jgi:hypothetical protein
LTPAPPEIVPDCPLPKPNVTCGTSNTKRGVGCVREKTRKSMGRSNRIVTIVEAPDWLADMPDMRPGPAWVAGRTGACAWACALTGKTSLLLPNHKTGIATRSMASTTPVKIHDSGKPLRLARPLRGAELPPEAEDVSIGSCMFRGPPWCAVDGVA